MAQQGDLPDVPAFTGVRVLHLSPKWHRKPSTSSPSSIVAIANLRTARQCMDTKPIFHVVLIHQKTYDHWKEQKFEIILHWSKSQSRHASIRQKVHRVHSLLWIHVHQIQFSCSQPFMLHSTCGLCFSSKELDPLQWSSLLDHKTRAPSRWLDIWTFYLLLNHLNSTMARMVSHIVVFNPKPNPNANRCQIPCRHWCQCDRRYSLRSTAPSALQRPTPEIGKAWPMA